MAFATKWSATLTCTCKYCVALCLLKKSTFIVTYIRVWLFVLISNNKHGSSTNTSNLTPLLEPAPKHSPRYAVWLRAISLRPKACSIDVSGFVAMQDRPQNQGKIVRFNKWSSAIPLSISIVSKLERCVVSMTDLRHAVHISVISLRL